MSGSQQLSPEGAGAGSARSKIDDLPRPADLSEASLITHRGCNDGTISALTFIKAGGKRENVNFVVAGGLERFLSQFKKTDTGKFLIIADIGLVQQDWIDWLEKRGNVALLDHHQTSAPLATRSWALIDCENGGTRCGSLLLQEYLGRDKVSIDVHILGLIVDDFDRWQRQYPTSAELSKLHAFLGQELMLDRLLELLEHPFPVFVCPEIVDWPPEEVYLLKVLEARNEENFDRIINKARDNVTVYGASQKAYNAVVVVSSELNTSVLLNQMLNEFSHCDVAIQINLEKGMASLRSRGDADCVDIALENGGGGHRSAAGHSIRDYVTDMIITEVYK